MLRKRTSLQDGEPDQLLAHSPTLRPSPQLPDRKVDLDGLEIEDLVANARPLPRAASPPGRPQAAERSYVARIPSEQGDASVPGPKVASRAPERARGEAKMQWIGPAPDLRPAIVLATILGPCRALGSGDGPYSLP